MPRAFGDKTSDKVFLLRYGSSSEKSYIEKTLSSFSGLLLKANFFESSREALTALLMQYQSATPHGFYVIDPMTHVYALDPTLKDKYSIRAWHVVDQSRALEALASSYPSRSPESLASTNLSGATSASARRRGKVEVCTVKEPFVSLARASLPDKWLPKVGLQPINTHDLEDEEAVNQLVQRTVAYQLQAAQSTLMAERYSILASGALEPRWVLSPYFCIGNDQGLDDMKRIWQSAAWREVDGSRAAVVLMIRSQYMVRHVPRIVEAVAGSSAHTVFFWIPGFVEHKEPEVSVHSLVTLVRSLSAAGKRVINLYGGGLSMSLLASGLDGLSNGPGYGMDRAELPVRGGAVQARYYIPSLGRRVGVLEAIDLLEKHGLLKSREIYLNRVCDCPICQGAVAPGVDNLGVFFGETVRNKSGTGSHASGEALKRCNYHFLLSRLEQFDRVRTMSVSDVLQVLKESIDTWADDGPHLGTWHDALI
jgi:hypothetical protein